VGQGGAAPAPAHPTPAQAQMARNLKTGLGKGVLSVTSPESRSLRDELKDAEGISSLLLTGDGVHVVVDDAALRIPEFKARLNRANIPFDAILQVAPSIEDLFVDAVEAGVTSHE